MIFESLILKFDTLGVILMNLSILTQDFPDM